MLRLILSTGFGSQRQIFRFRTKGFVSRTQHCLCSHRRRRGNIHPSPPPSILLFGNCLFICFFDFVSDEYVSWFAGYKMRTMLCIIVLSLCLLRCAFFHSTPGLFYINFPISNSSSFFVRLGFIILKQVRQVVLSSNLLSSVLRIVLVGNFGQVCHFHLFF